MTEHLKYTRLVLYGAFGKFTWGRDLTVGFLTNLATLLLTSYFGLISVAEWDAHKRLFILAVVLPYVVIILPHVIWRIFKAASDLHFNQVVTIANLHNEKTVAEGALKEFTEAGPNIVLREPGAKHVQQLSLNDGRVIILTAQFVKVRFVNKPLRNTESVVARGVSAKIKLFNDSGHVVLEMDGRWDDSDQPTLRHPTLTRRDLLLTDFGIEEEHNLDIAFRDPNLNAFVAFNNDNYGFQHYRKPEHVLVGNKLTAEIRLVAVNVDAKFSVEFIAEGPRGDVAILNS